MKRIVFVFSILCLLCNISFSQQKNLTFKGIPIKGDMVSFAENLKKQGYKQLDLDLTDCIALKGEFTGEDCIILVCTTPITKTVYQILVLFDKEYTSWPSIKSDFQEKKKLYTQKYGTPSDDFSFFQPPFEENDGYEMTALKQDKCTYIVFYTEPQGDIFIRMDNTCRIGINYRDKVGYKLHKEESNKQSINEI